MPAAPSTRWSRPLGAMFTPDQDRAAAEMLRIRNVILLDVATEAERCIAEGVVSGRAEAELLAIDAGYPLWTGGPLTYAERHAVHGGHE